MKNAVLILSVLAVIALAVLNLTYQDGPKPDRTFPFANQKIVWEK